MNDSVLIPTSATPMPKNGLSPQDGLSAALMPIGGTASVLSAGSRFLNVIRPALFLAVCVFGALLLSPPVSGADSREDLGFGRWLTISGNFDGGYRKTQFFEDNHNAAVGQWDTRLEVWLPPFREEFSYGPYLRFAGIAASRDPAWENALLAGPGGGFQVYPFSLAELRKPDSVLGKLLGPLRLYGEYNRLDYWGQVNSWRPDEQIRAGAEYWRARHVNETSWPWWTEFWTGLHWQSANEFDRHYDSVIFANAFRAGARIPKAGFLSAITPYAALESSLTENKNYYWENRLLVGGGLRLAPSRSILPDNMRWLNRFVFYAEYLHAAAYYRRSAPSSVPDHDVRVGISFSIGEWYR